jgi:hypothetical protein
VVSGVIDHANVDDAALLSYLVITIMNYLFITVNSMFKKIERPRKNNIGEKHYIPGPFVRR